MPEVDVNFQIVAPIVTLVVAALIVLILDLILPAQRVRRPLVWVTAAGMALAGWYIYDLWQAVPAPGLLPDWSVTVGDITTGLTAFLGSIVADRFGLLFGGIALIAAMASVGMSVRRREEDVSGYYALILLATAGMMLLASASSLMSMFLGLELLSLALYVVVGFRRNDMRGKEGALKYLILGSVASGVLLYGFALLYGATGSVWLAEFQSYWHINGVEGMTTLYKAGMALALAGFAFKLALVPFHTWAPDAYEGAPASISGFMAVGTKAAALAALVRLLVVGVPAEALMSVIAPLSLLAALSMFVGSILATVQRNMKRLLAYSGVAHAGYLMMALPGLSTQGVAAVSFYMLAYMFMTLGAFAIVIWLGDSPNGGADIAKYQSLFYRRPYLAGALTLFLLSLSGIPVTAGFVGKVLLVRNAIEFGGTLLVVALVATTAISAFAYLRIVLSMSRRPEQSEAIDHVYAEVAVTTDAANSAEVASVLQDDGELELNWPLACVVTFSAIGTVYLGLFPQAALALLQTLLPLQ